MTIGLAVIVKDEAERLPRLAASVAGKLDHVTVIDTGSTDGTLDLLPTLFDCSTSVIETSWEGFGAARQLAIAKASAHTDWVLYLDADETLHGDLVEGDADADLVYAEERHAGGFVMLKPRMFRANQEWEYVGRTHEYVVTENTPGERADGWWVEARNDGARRPVKFEDDLRLLRLDWAQEQTPRTAFYMARTHEDLGNLQQAVTWYARRAGMGGWAEEAWYARWRLGLLLLGGDVWHGVAALWEAWEARPHRAEPLVTLAEHYRNVGQHRLAWVALELARQHGDPSGDVLFVHGDCYRWRQQYERVLTAWYVGEIDEGKTAIDAALEDPEIPGWAIETLNANRGFYDGSVLAQCAMQVDTVGHGDAHHRADGVSDQ